VLSKLKQKVQEEGRATMRRRVTKLTMTKKTKIRTRFINNVHTKDEPPTKKVLVEA